MIVDEDKGAGERQRSPLPAKEQDAPVPERPLNTQEERGQSLQEMEHPPQAEGDREDIEDSLRRQAEKAD